MPLPLPLTATLATAWVGVGNFHRLEQPITPPGGLD